MNLYSKHDVEVRVDVVEKRLRDWGFANCFRGIRVSVVWGAFQADFYTSRLKDYLIEENFVRPITELCKTYWRVLSGEQVKSREKMWNRFVMIAGDVEGDLCAGW